MAKHIMASNTYHVNSRQTDWPQTSAMSLISLRRSFETSNQQKKWHLCNPKQCLRLRSGRHHTCKYVVCYQLLVRVEQCLEHNVTRANTIFFANVVVARMAFMLDVTKHLVFEPFGSCIGSIERVLFENALCCTLQTSLCDERMIDVYKTSFFVWR